MLDLQSAIYVWKGKGATLDARNVGLQLGAHFTCVTGTTVQILTQNVLLARDLSSSREQPQPPDAVARRAQRTCPVVSLPQ